MLLESSVADGQLVRSEQKLSQCSSCNVLVLPVLCVCVCVLLASSLYRACRATHGLTPMFLSWLACLVQLCVACRLRAELLWHV